MMIMALGHVGHCGYKPFKTSIQKFLKLYVYKKLKRDYFELHL